jgi:hypothetical protein
VETDARSASQDAVHFSHVNGAAKAAPSMDSRARNSGDDASERSAPENRSGSSRG